MNRCTYLVSTIENVSVPISDDEDSMLSQYSEIDMLERWISIRTFWLSSREIM